MAAQSAPVVKIRKDVLIVETQYGAYKRQEDGCVWQPFILYFLKNKKALFTDRVKSSLTPLFLLRLMMADRLLS
jgi:hypothetical protein